MRFKSDERSLLARIFARDSKARPKRTNANSIVGSSKKRGQPSFGIATEIALIAKLLHAPNDTNVFIFGLLLTNDVNPSDRI